MAVCRFDTKKNAFHKTSALVTITTVPTPQDRALMWTATPGKSANHGSPWHCNVTLLWTSADKYYHSDYWITVALPFVSQCLWEASVEVYTACVWRCVSCDRRDTLHQLWWTQVLISWTLPIRTSSGKASILALSSLSSSVPHIHLFSLVLLSAEQDYCNGLEGTFRVLVENSACGIAGYRCSKSITVLYMGGLIVMEHNEVKWTPFIFTSCVK